MQPIRLPKIVIPAPSAGPLGPPGAPPPWIPLDSAVTARPADEHARVVYVSGLLVPVRVVVLAWDIPPIVLASGGGLPAAGGPHECHWLTCGLWERICRQCAAVEDGRGVVRDPAGVVTPAVLLERWAVLDGLWRGGEVRRFRVCEAAAAMEVAT